MAFSEEISRIIGSPDPTITSVIAKMSEGSRNDFYSNGDYWWPDPSKEDGLPYIRRDGLSNPDNFTAHRHIMLKMVHDAELLYQDGSREAAAKLNSMMRTFFLDPCTRMNPSLNFSQAIPGVCAGRSIGLIDTLHLVDIPFLLRKMKATGIADEDIYEGVSAWFSEYTQWLIESEFGRKEGSEHNNHSIAYYAQLASFSSCSPDKAEIHSSCIRFFKEQVIGRQMAADGSFPFELARTKPYSYSIFAFDLACYLAEVIDEEDLWHYESDGKSIRKGLDFIVPYIREKSAWPYGSDVQHWDELPVRASFLAFASKAYDDPGLMELWKALPAADDITSEVYRNSAVKLADLYF